MSEKTFRIQGTVTQKERQEFLECKKNFEEKKLAGVKLSDGQYIMMIAKSIDKELSKE